MTWNEGPLPRELVSRGKILRTSMNDPGPILLSELGLVIVMFLRGIGATTHYSKHRYYQRLTAMYEKQGNGILGLALLVDVVHIKASEPINLNTCMELGILV